MALCCDVLCVRLWTWTNGKRMRLLAAVRPCKSAQGREGAFSTRYHHVCSPVGVDNRRVGVARVLDGWLAARRYQVNLLAAGYLSWGKGAGCSLPQKSCSVYMAEVPGQSLFCTDSECVGVLAPPRGVHDSMRPDKPPA